MGTRHCYAVSSCWKKVSILSWDHIARICHKAVLYDATHLKRSLFHQHSMSSKPQIALPQAKHSFPTGLHNLNVLSAWQTWHRLWSISIDHSSIITKRPRQTLVQAILTWYRTCYLVWYMYTSRARLTLLASSAAEPCTKLTRCQPLLCYSRRKVCALRTLSTCVHPGLTISCYFRRGSLPIAPICTTHPPTIRNLLPEPWLGMCISGCLPTTSSTKCNKQEKTRDTYTKRTPAVQSSNLLLKYRSFGVFWCIACLLSLPLIHMGTKTRASLSARA